jgi:hypothetical protein
MLMGRGANRELGNWLVAVLCCVVFNKLLSL